ncbi:MAG: acyl-CoA thioesterase [Lachnospiraceae bacterium]|nr:acyl-CoA thioesterase [Lachnospiraceae bacterium]
MQEYTATHLVKGEDLNHHGTLFAARGAAWFVESAFIAAACAQGDTSQVVCRNLHGMSFRKPVKKGSVLQFKSRIVHAGRTSLMVHVSGGDALTGETAIEGYVTFVTVEEGSGRKLVHGIVLDEPQDEEEKRQREEAAELLRV